MVKNILFIIQKLFFEQNTMKPHLCRIRSLFSEFHDLKTETRMRWKEPLERQCPLLQYRKSGNTLTYYLNRIKV